MAARTLAAVAGRTATRPLMTFETVCFVTPARSATSCIVTISAPHNLTGQS